MEGYKILKFKINIDSANKNKVKKFLYDALREVRISKSVFQIIINSDLNFDSFKLSSKEGVINNALFINSRY